MKAQKQLLILLIVFALMTFIMAGCGGNDNGNTAFDPNDNNGNIVPDSIGDENGKPADNNGSSDFQPSVPVPDGLPVYPGAELWNDLPSLDDDWQWLYSTTGSGNEIVDFFTTALQDLGFDIDEDSTFALYEEFFVATSDMIVRVYWLAGEESDLTPDTPNRGYGIIVNPEKWEAR